MSVALLISIVMATAACVWGSAPRSSAARARSIVSNDRHKAMDDLRARPRARAERDRVAHRLREAPVVASLLRTALRRRRMAGDRAASTELIAGLAAELRAGAPPATALDRASRSSSRCVCPHALAAARYGGDVALALDRDALERGLSPLRALAALWRVSHNSGAGMAQAAQRLAQAEAASEVVRRELTTQLAGPKASARVLAGLPGFGLLLGAGLGASPVAWLVGSPAGLLVLMTGIGLEIVGLLWVHRLVRSVESLL